MFARLAELDLAAAEKAHAKLMAAEETSDIAELGRTYHRMARSLRQTLALKAKLTREREDAEAKRPRKPEPSLPNEGLRPLAAGHRAHIERVRQAAMPYLERERPDWDELDDATVYEILIELTEEDDDFLDTPVETLVARLLEIMELPPPDVAPGDRPGAEPALQDSA
jgi:hypothetical protein